MKDLLKLYTQLLDVYIEQVKNFENIKSENPLIRWIPSAFLNSRMFTYDEYIQNPFYGGGCYKEKNTIMPHLIRFIVVYEDSTDEAKKNFEQNKIQNDYQKQLDSLILDKIPIMDFLKSQITDLQRLEYTYKIPHLPKRKNATRQLAKYKVDRKEYFNKIESLNRCREEVRERIKLIEKIKVELKNNYL